MLIAEDLLLLVTDDASGRLTAPAEKVDLGLGGANLVELALMRRVELSRAGDRAKPGRIVVRDPAPTGDGVLDAALDILVARQGKRPSAVIGPLSKGLRPTLYERLAAGGVVRAQEGRALGIFPTHRWPARDARHEAEVRRLMTLALVQQVEPDARTAGLIALVHALRCEHRIVDPRQCQVSGRQLSKRAEEIATGSWASEAVRTEIDEMMAAVLAAVSVPVVVSAGS